MRIFLASILLLFFSIFNPVSILFSQNKKDLTAIPYYIEFEKNIKNIKTFTLSTLGKNMEYIPLETNPSCTVQTIERIEFSETFLFVNEVRRLLQFTKEGKFVRQIGAQGRGPGEYLTVGDFCINREKEEIYIISPPNLLIYGFDGRYKTTFKISFRPSQIIEKDKDHLFYHLWNVPGKSFEDRNNWITSDKTGMITQSIKYNIKRVSQPGLIIGDTPLYKFNNVVHFMEFACDTLFYFQNDIVKPYAVFNFGDLKMEPDPLIIQSQKENITKKLFNRYWIYSILENKDFFFIKLAHGISDSSNYALFSKNNSTFSIVKDNQFLNDVDGGMPFWPDAILDDNLIVDFVDAFDLIKACKTHKTYIKQSTKLESVIKNITETSNPVIMILHL